MKMNFVQPSIPFCRIVKVLLFFLIISRGISNAATWTGDESTGLYTYHWEISEGEIQDFIKSGHISKSELSGTFLYEGRFYPIYSKMLANAPDILAFRLQNKEECCVSAEELWQDYKNIDALAIDALDIRDFQDFVHIRNIPGLGSLVEITPIIPQEGSRIRCLKHASIQIFSTDNTALREADLSAKRQKSLAKPASLKIALPQEYVALYIHEAGAYQVRGQDLVNLGIDLRKISPDNLKLSHWGEQIPCRVSSSYEKNRELFQAHDVIQFIIPEMKNPYGDYLYNPFTDYDVILLSWDSGKGLRYIQESSQISGTASFLPQENDKFRCTIHIERNQQYQSLARLHEEELSHKHEHRFFSPSISVGRSVSFPFELRDPLRESPYNVDFTLRMQGLTYSKEEQMDHRIYVTLNDRYVLEDEWKGQLANISTNSDVQYSHKYLKNGVNSVNISVKGFDGDPYKDDIVLFDWLKISYDRYMIAHNNRLEFSPQHGPGRYLFRVKGLSSATDVLILKNNRNWIRGYYITPEDTIKGEVFYSIYFEDQCEGDEHYWIAGPGKKDLPAYGVANIDSMRYVNRSENMYYNREEQGDYLIISHKDFYEAALELLEHKKQMGFKPVLYELERIYDEYNFGNESPYAIKSFLTEAYHHWSPRPYYVLFIGDTGTKNSFPVIRYQSSGSTGAVLAENWFVDIDDDFMMEMALGRLPVHTAEELDAIIRKIKIYDLQEMPLRAQNRVLLLSGPEAVFRTHARDYVNRLSPDHVQCDRIYLYDTNVSGDFDAGLQARDTLLKYINHGVYCINYFGHGSGYTWDNYVLPYSSFENLNGESPFIVNSMTCFSNTFSNDNAIGEMFIRHPKAAVSVFAFTGYGWINSNYYIFNKLMQNLYLKKMSHGDALRYALAEYFFSSYGKNANFIDREEGKAVYKYFRKSLFYQSCILGDPSICLPYLQDAGAIAIEPQSISSGQTLEIKTEQKNICGGILDLTMMRGEERKYPMKQKITLSFSDGQASIKMPEIKENTHAGILQLLCWDNNGQAYCGDQRIAYNAPYIVKLDYHPQKPGVSEGKGAYLRMQTGSGRDIDRAQLRVYRDPVIGAAYQKLKLLKKDEGVFETEYPIYYNTAENFHSAENDTAAPISFYSGNYFMPIFYLGEDSLSADFYCCRPNLPQMQDLAILDYCILNGKSKLLLSNQADTTVNVAIEIRVKGYPDLCFRDTVLSYYDVQGCYEKGHEKINSFYLDFLPPYGESEVEIQIRALEIIDSDSSNNVKSFNVHNPWLCAESGHLLNCRADSLLLSSNHFLSLNPGKQLSGKQVICIELRESMFSLQDFGASQAFESHLYINAVQEEIDFWGVLHASGLSGEIRLAYLSEDASEFYILPLKIEKGKMLFPIRRKGYYLFTCAEDTKPPHVEVNMNARQILNKGYASERSDFSVILRDDKGVHPLPEFREVLLDGEKIPEENISVLRGKNIRELGLNFKLKLNAGEHALQIVAHDLVGNRSETEKYQLLYSEEPKLIDYGNFPNPFRVQTTFIYELTEQFDDIKIKIYTSFGQKIYSISPEKNAITDFPLQNIGYHEVPWLGKDEFGNTVANAVYFYVIEGSIEGRVIKSRGKLAKLR